MYKILPALAAFGLFFLPVVANAHAFGQQYTLPLPFSFYALGASCALFASFVFLVFYDSATAASSVISVKMIRLSRWIVIENTLRIIGVLGFAGTIICAFWGVPDFLRNPASELFWTMLLLGFTYLSVFIGDLWRFVSPFETIARIIFFANKTPPMRYPRQLGYIPAIVFYYGLIWLELLSYGAGATPSIIGSILIGYLMISIVGTGIFGADEWFTHADFFTVFFGLVGLFAPIQLERKYMKISVPTTRLILEHEGRVSLLIFILLMLSSTAFDGLQETHIWWQTLFHSSFQMAIYPLERGFIFLLSPFLFLSLYALAVYVTQLLVRNPRGFQYLLTRFAFSLIPIAIAYNFAHYFTLLINSAQALYAMASDPLGKGWDLFGTAHYQVNIGLIGAKEIWYTQFSAIVFGHIIATYVAHRIASFEFISRKQMLYGQFPMLLLMVFYTVFGLWILSQGYQAGI